MERHSPSFKWKLAVEPVETQESHRVEPASARVTAKRTLSLTNRRGHPCPGRGCANAEKRGLAIHTAGYGA